MYQHVRSQNSQMYTKVTNRIEVLQVLLPGSAVSGRARLEESRDEQLDHAAGIVARVVAGANAEAADATQQFVGINIGADLAGFSSGVQQLSANGHEAVKEVGT